MEESDTPQGFKVTDKRRFSTEGETKTDDQPQAQERAEQLPSEGEPAVGAPKEGAKAESARPRTPPAPMDFTNLVVSLANTAFFQLGLAKGTEGGPEKDIDGARQTIDILSLLEKKTEGNLTPEEKKILTEVLFQLRLAFVEVSKSRA